MRFYYFNVTMEYFLFLWSRTTKKRRINTIIHNSTFHSLLSDNKQLIWIYTFYNRYELFLCFGLVLLLTTKVAG